MTMQQQSKSNFFFYRKANDQMTTIYDRDWAIAVPLKLEMNTFSFFKQS